RWSVRLMWRAGGTNELYVYEQGREAGACGTRSPTMIPFQTGRWTAVSVHVRLNTPRSAHDGRAQMEIDGRLAREARDIQFRSTTGSRSRISNIFFSTFYGGNEQKRLWCNDTSHRSHPDWMRYCGMADPMADVTWRPRQT